MWVTDTVPPTLHNRWLRLTWVIGLRKAPFNRIWSSVNLLWLIGLLWKCPRIGRQAGFCFYPKSTYILTEWLWAARQRIHPCKLRRTKPDGSREYTIQHSTMWAHLREPALALVFFMSLLSATTTFLYIFRHRFSNICLASQEQDIYTFQNMLYGLLSIYQWGCTVTPHLWHSGIFLFTATIL